jgi:hypothetical protein
MLSGSSLGAIADIKIPERYLLQSPFKPPRISVTTVAFAIKR